MEAASKKTKKIHVIVCVVAILAISFAFLRLFFGVGLADEASHVGYAYRLVLGDRPFIDDWTAHQFQALITYPFFSLYDRVMGGTDGIILYGRFLYFTFCIILAAAVFTLVQKWLDWPSSLLIAVVCMLVPPSNGPHLCAKFLQMNLFTLGIVWGILAVMGNGSRLLLFLAGVAHGLAVFSIPTVALAAAFFAYYLFRRLPSGLRKRGVFYLAGGVLVFCVFLPDLLNFSLATVKSGALHQAGGNRGFLGLLAKFPRLLSQGFQFSFKGRIITAVIVLILLLQQLQTERMSRFVWAAFSLFPWLMWTDIEESSTMYISFYGLIAGLFFLYSDRPKGTGDLLEGAYIPSIVAGFTSAWSSSDGFYLFGMGMLPAALVTSVMVNHAAGELAVKFPRFPFRFTGHIWNISVLAILVAYHSNMGHQEDRLRFLSKRIDFGPYKGLYTNFAKRDYLEEISADVVKYAQPGGRIFFYHLFPAGYLMTRMRPASHYLFYFWECFQSLEPVCKETFRQELGRWNDPRDVVVRVNRLYYSGDRTDVWPEGPADEYIRQRYREVLSKKNYTIFTAAK